MTAPVLHSGSQIANDVRSSSAKDTPEAKNPRTLQDLLDILATTAPSDLSMLRTTSALLVSYLNKNPEMLLLDSVNDSRDRFRPYLEERPYAENSIRSYVNYARILLKHARDFGWKPASEVIPEEWQRVLLLAAKKECKDLARFLAGRRKTPKEVTIEDVDRWVELRTQQGLSNARAKRKMGLFWRLLRDCGATEQIPMCILREKHYRLPLDQFPPDLKREFLGLMKWKQAAFAIGRPKGGRLRDVTAKQLQDIVCGLLGFALNILGESGIASLPDVVQERIVMEFLEWCINERKVKAYSLASALRLLAAAMRQYPPYKSIDFNWFKPLLDSIPTEPEFELRKRKASKYLEYNVIEAIPAKIRLGRSVAAKKGPYRVARLTKEELLMKWLGVLPWRQRNLRECRIRGNAPNLFRGKIPPFCNIDKPAWVLKEEQENPEAEFWQFRFSSEETKTGIDVHAVLPRPLIGLLEEYLKEFRPLLLRGPDPGTLFVNKDGQPMSLGAVDLVISTMTLRHGGRRVTPHIYRDIFAFAWLKEHPSDYLTLAKILWHSNINTTIRKYGSQFNESSGVCSAESWVEGREAKST